MNHQDLFKTFAIAVLNLFLKSNHPILNHVNNRRRGSRGNGHRPKVIPVHTGRRPVSRCLPPRPLSNLVKISTSHCVSNHKFHHINNGSDLQSQSNFFASNIVGIIATFIAVVTSASDVIASFIFFIISPIDIIVVIIAIIFAN